MCFIFAGREVVKCTEYFDNISLVIFHVAPKIATLFPLYNVSTLNVRKDVANNTYAVELMAVINVKNIKLMSDPIN